MGDLGTWVIAVFIIGLGNDLNTIDKPVMDGGGDGF